MDKNRNFVFIFYKAGEKKEIRNRWEETNIYYMCTLCQALCLAPSEILLAPLLYTLQDLFQINPASFQQH